MPIFTRQKMVLFDEFYDLLMALDGVEQNPIYHPEGDALTHSLQVFAHALLDSDDPQLWAAALFHDIGKASDRQNHAAIGASELADLSLHPRIVWLVRHHTDLLDEPHKTRRKLRASRALSDLERLRRWDLAGRDPRADTLHPQQAIAQIIEHLDILCDPHPKGA